MAKKKAAKKCAELRCTNVIANHCRKRTDVIRMQKNEAGRWFWFGFSTGNQKNTGTSGEDYSTRMACMTEALDHATQLGVPLEVWE